MWSRKQLKDNAKKILSKNYWKAFLVTLVLITVTGAGSGAFSGISNGMSSFSNYNFNRSSSNDAKTSLNTDRKDKDQDKDQDKENGKGADVNVDLGKDGKISVKVENGKVFINGKEITAEDGDVKVVINGKTFSVNGGDGKVKFDGNEFNIGDANGSVSFENGKLVIKDDNGGIIFNGDINEGKEAIGIALGIFAVIFGAVMFFVCVIGTLLDIFLINPVRVGGYNFFNRQRESTSKFTNIFGGFAHGHYKASVRNMFLKGLYETLWSMLFIIPGIIKSYSYWMVPYITAANPNLSASRAFEISKKTMNGNKWRTFVLQLSFIGWDLLAALTFGIGYYFLAPYKETTYAELYAALKEKAVTSGIATEEELAIAA
ncbi:MAG: DUF975 family protein [Saccharofermentans sp.]|nr:DUF975 family protein [Saccharofermentans sp.]